MAQRIEDCALIGDMETAALVSMTGSIDWLCLPRFDSGACFAALLGGGQNGRWLLAPQGGGVAVARRYRPGTLVLETEFETDVGVVRVIDYMPPRSGYPVIDRVVECLRGRVLMETRLAPRFGYGRRMPGVQHTTDGVVALAGPDALVLRAPVDFQTEEASIFSEFTVSAGEQLSFRLGWYPSHETTPEAGDALAELAATDRWWRAWSERCTYAGPNKEAVVRSLITLKALTCAPTGGIVAAPTSSLSEELGGSRNWDYRYCWLRDASVTLAALVRTGYLKEATAWRDWLERAVAGDPSEMQIMYGLGAPQTDPVWLCRPDL